MSQIKNYLDTGRGMTVAELREQLERFDDEDIVLLAYTASDYWRSPIATRIESVEESDVFYTAYHQCAQEADKNRDPDDEETVRVVVIR